MYVIFSKRKQLNDNNDENNKKILIFFPRQKHINDVQ